MSDKEYQVAGLRDSVECYPKYGDCVIVDCAKCRIEKLEAENKAIREAFEESEYPELFWDECEKLLENEQ